MSSSADAVAVTPPSPEVPCGVSPRWIVIVWFTLILGCWAIRGLPWNLDEYDQAKQAYTSWEMIGQDHWWWQHTPRQDQATKPPLAGWVSAGIYRATGSWDLAWRLPSFLAAGAVLWLLWKSGRRVARNVGGFVATGAFAWNMLTIRLATLVRTDMLLTFFIFAAGWLIWRRLESREKWTWCDSGWLTLLLAAGAMTKGPIYHAFLLPGLIGWVFLARENPQRGRITGHYLLVSLVSVIPFLIWTWWRIRQDPAFYDQVVVREFLGRFTTGEKAVHNNQTFYFYLPHLLAKCAPWSLAVLGAVGCRSIREHLRKNPAVLWLACWAVGGVVMMSLVPSKRVDRIFPVVPVFALWLAAILPALPQWKLTPQKLAAGFCGLSALIFLTYTGVSVAQGYHRKLDALVRFGVDTQKIAATNHWTIAVAEGRDEGMLMYLGQQKFCTAKEIRDKFRAGEISAAVVDDKALSSLQKGDNKIKKMLTVNHHVDQDYHYHLVLP